MAEYLPFKDLYQHLAKYVKNEEQRWKHCMRIKRCLASQNDCGGYGKDQRYFEGTNVAFKSHLIAGSISFFPPTGAVTILREQANINFSHLMAGKLSLDDLHASREVYTTENIHLPYFMQNIPEYRARLQEMARLNGIPVTPHGERTRFTISPQNAPSNIANTLVSCPDGLPPAPTFVVDNTPADLLQKEPNAVPSLKNTHKVGLALMISQSLKKC